MRKTLESLSLRVLLGILGFTIVAFYVTKRFYYPPIPPPVQVDSAFLDDVKPAVIVNVDSCNFYVNKSLEYYNYGNFDLSLKAAEKAVTFNGLSEYAEKQ